MKKFFTFLKKKLSPQKEEQRSFVPETLRPKTDKRPEKRKPRQADPEKAARESRDSSPRQDQPQRRSKSGRPKKAPQSPGTQAPAPPRDKAPAKPARPQKKRWAIEDFQVEPKDGEIRFHDLDLPWSVMHAIADLKWQYCTPIQAQLLEHTLGGRDATAKAQTGTGKSASFILTLLARFLKNQIKHKKGSPRAIILAPTRELVHQIEKDFKALARYTPIRIVSVYGGTGYHKQQQQLTEKPVDVIAATPGRLIDFMGKRLIDASRVEVMVIDEADRMLDMGFIPDVRRIVLKTPHKDKRQTLFFSATLTEDVIRLAKSWTRDAVQIEIDPEQTASDSVKQIVYISTEDDKFKHVFNLIDSEKLTRVILFVNRKDTARILAEKLERYGQKCAALSGDLPQNKRFRVLEDFKNSKINLLVATDVAARGLHIENISHVINYDLPNEADHYIHRIGRTGRAGATGTSISFADEMSSFFIPDIEAVLGYKVSCEYPSEALEKELPKPGPRKKRPPSKPSSRKGRKPYRGGRNPRSSGRPRKPRS